MALQNARQNWQSLTPPKVHGLDHDTLIRIYPRNVSLAEA